MAASDSQPLIRTYPDGSRQCTFRAKSTHGLKPIPCPAHGIFDLESDRLTGEMGVNVVIWWCAWEDDGTGE